MAAPVSELGWVVHFAPVVRFTPLSPTDCAVIWIEYIVFGLDSNVLVFRGFKCRFNFIYHRNRNRFACQINIRQPSIISCKLL